MFSSSQRPLPDSAQHSQQTNIHASVGIRTHNISRRAATNLRPKPRGHCDRLSTFSYDYFEFFFPPIYFVRFKYKQTPTERQPLSSLMKVIRHNLWRTLTALYHGFSESCVSYTVNRRHRTTIEENLLASSAYNLEFQPFSKNC